MVQKRLYGLLEGSQAVDVTSVKIRDRRDS